MPLSRPGNAVRMELKVQWGAQDAGDARDVQSLRRKATGSPEGPWAGGKAALNTQHSDAAAKMLNTDGATEFRVGPVGFHSCFGPGLPCYAPFFPFGVGMCQWTLEVCTF